jgi:hypothetical protein
MSYIEYLRDKKLAQPQIISPTRINTAGLFTQMQRYKAAVPQGNRDSAGISVQHRSGSNVLATVGNAAVCCAPVQETVMLPVVSKGTTTSGWPALIVGDNENSMSYSEAISFNGDSVFTTGFFQGTVDLYEGGVTDPSTATPVITLRTAIENTDGFVAAYNKAGQIQWATIIETRSGSRTVGYHIAVDNTGLYVVGSFDGFIEFYNGVTSGLLDPVEGTGVASLTLGDSPIGLFIAKYSLSGVVQWVTKIENVANFDTFVQSQLYTTGICVNGSNLYVSGSFVDICANVYNSDDTIQITIPSNFPGEFLINALLVQYNTSGMAQWATKMDISMDVIEFGGSVGVGIACDSTGAYMSGVVFGSVNYYNTVANNTDTFSSLGSLMNQIGLYPSMFIISYLADGTFNWVNQADNTDNNFLLPGGGIRLSVDATGVYALSLYGDGLNVYTNPGVYDVSEQLTSPVSDILNFAIVKYSTAGQVLWINKITNLSPPDLSNFSNAACGIYADGSSLYITGSIIDVSINLYIVGSTDPIASLNPIVSPGVDLFLVRYNAFGRPQWMTIAGSAEGTESGVGVGFDGTHVFLTGWATGAVDFYNANGLSQPTTIITSMNGSDQNYSFVVEYDENGQVVPMGSTQTGGCCSLKLRPYPWNGYAARRPDPPAINYPPVDPSICKCSENVRTILPDPPTNLVATSGDTIITVAFTPGASNGSPITNYVYSLNGGPNIPFSPPIIDSPFIITGLTNGTPYTITFAAVNANGTSAQSASITATPSSLGAPNLVLIIPDNSGAYLYFTPGANTNFTSTYAYTTDGGATFTPLILTASPVLIPDLSNGQEYSIQMTASVGLITSPLSNTLTVTPVLTPNATGPMLYYDPSNNASYSGSGTTVNSVGSDNTVSGTIIEGVSYVADPAGGASSVFNFDGSSGYISFGTFDFGTTITITAWINPSLNPSWEEYGINTLIANGTSGLSSPGFKFAWNSWQSNDRVCLLEAGNDSDGSAPASVPDVITYGVWQHVGYVFDQVNSTVIFFVNGVPVNILNINTTTEIPTSGQTFNIGAFADGYYLMKAYLGYIKVYDYKMNAADMFADFESSKARFGL